MKSFRLLVALFFCIFFLSSCSEDGDDAVNPSFGLAGKWKVTDISYEGTSTTTVAGFTSSVEFTAKGVNMDVVSEFKEGPNKVTSGGSYEVLMKMNHDGQEVEMTVPGFPFVMSGDWQKDGNKIVLQYENQEDQVADILQLDDKTLKIGYEQLISNEVNGAVVEIQTKAVFIYNKL